MYLYMCIYVPTHICVYLYIIIYLIMYIIKYIVIYVYTHTCLYGYMTSSLCYVDKSIFNVALKDKPNWNNFIT